MRYVLALLCAILFVIPAIAQTTMVTQPLSTATVVNASSTITATNTFQSVFAAVTNPRGRVSCTIQSKAATDPIYVYFGAIAGATTDKSVKLTPGQAVFCSINNIVLNDQVSITGTMGDAFYAAQQ